VCLTCYCISLTNEYDQAVRQNAKQVLKAHSFSLDSAADSAAALKAVCEVHGGAAPDAVFACAGSSKPMYFIEMSEQDLSQGMTAGYWVQAWTAFVCFKCLSHMHCY
jgi:3-dehydrosphinganine reductase